MVGRWAAGRSGIFAIQMIYLACLGVFVILYRAQWLIDPGKGFFGPVPSLSCPLVWRGRRGHPLALRRVRARKGLG